MKMSLGGGTRYVISYKHTLGSVGGRLYSVERNEICKLGNGMESVDCGTVKRGMTECGPPESVKCGSAERRNTDRRNL